MRRVIGAALVTLVTSVSAAQEMPPVGVPAPASAHPDTAAGVDAFVRGDYARAAEVLRPVVEAWPSNGSDDTAAFFLGSLYDSGLGTPQDRIKACALYERAARNPGPVGGMARAASAALRATLGEREWSDCVLLINMGTGHRFAPIQVTVSDDYTVAIDLRSNPRQGVVGTVTRAGKSKLTTIDLPVQSGMVFFPVEFTELQVGGVAPGPRRFVEVAAWVPSPERNWNLAWTIVEVVGTDLMPVTTQFLSTVAGPALPDDLSLHLRDLVDLRVNDAGEAEWAILGPTEEHQVIETAARRREIEERNQRRNTAAKRMKGNARRDPYRAPSLAYVDADGCGDVMMFGWTAEGAETIAVRADREALQLSTTPRTFDLAQPQVDIEVVTEVFEHGGGSPLCGDVRTAPENEQQETWRAVGGLMTIQLSKPGISARNPEQYRTTVQIDNAEFMGSTTGARVRAPRPIRITAVTGPAAVAEEP
jgi:hypothetical protein